MGKRENAVEKLLNQEVIKLGGLTRKYKSQPGVADRLCFLPGGHLWLIELKTYDGKKSTPQERERERMVDLGFRARFAFGEQSVMDIIAEMKEVINGTASHPEHKASRTIPVPPDKRTNSTRVEGSGIPSSQSESTTQRLNFLGPDQGDPGGTEGS